MSYGGLDAIIRMRRQLTTVACRQCEGQGYTVESRSELAYGHACGGDERRCQVTCPVPDEIEVQVQVGCPHCQGTGRA